MLVALKERYDAIVPGGKVDSSFSFAHVLLALLSFELHGKLGRTALSRLLDLGRGSLRTFHGRLKDGLGLIMSESTKAHVLTSRGVEVVSAMRKEITVIGNLPTIFDEFTLSACNASVHLPGRIHHDPGFVTGEIDPIKLVDVARASGGDGLLSIIAGPGKTLELVAVQMDVRKRYSREWQRLNELFPLQPGDAVLIASASTETRAKLAAIAAALDLLERAST